MNIWKIASRWSYDGNADSSVIHLFRKYQIVFVDNLKPNEESSFNIEQKVQIDDLVALSDGQYIVAIGKVLQKPSSIIDIWNFEEDMDDFYFENVIGIKIKLFDLLEEEQFVYEKWGRFHALHNEEAKKVTMLWEKQFSPIAQNKTFSIHAKTCTLKYNTQNSKDIVLDNQAKYTIPIYQRPYSWTDEQVRKFLSDIFLSYWGSESTIIEEPMFIGTMQLTKKSYDNEQEIIDGQQRLTTFLVLLKVLSLKYAECSELQTVTLNWLETRVNNGREQQKLKELINIESIQHEDSNNSYFYNAKLVLEIFEEQIKEDKEESFDINRFVKYILGNIYFVVIETHASLTKTLQIFNAINTTGLDLNGGDIFKLRMYEYLCDKDSTKDDDKKSLYFEQISSLYALIDEINNKNGWVTSIFEVLEIYKYVLISKYDLPKTLYFYETNRFYEEMFDTLFNINRWDNFKTIKEKKLELSLNELEKIIEARFSWHSLYSSIPTAEDACAWHFIWWSRYSRYHVLTYLFTYKYSKDSNFKNKLLLFNRQLSKLFSIYSIRYQKLKSEIYYTFMYELIDTIISGNIDTSIELINTKIGKLEDHKYSYDLEEILKGDITYNTKLKNIVCRLSAMLEEEYKSNDINILHRIFSSIDVEHIQAYHDIDEEKREEIWAEWGGDINSLGNLIVLEQTINRQIQNKPFEEKVEYYKESEFQAIQNIVKSYKKWNYESCKKRKKIEVNKIIKYFFDDK